MEIKDLEINKKFNELIGIVESLGEPIEMPSGSKVQEGVLSDPTGQVRLSLWDDQIGTLHLGDKINMVSGWCKEFPTDSGNLQVSSGKFGKIKILGE